MRQTNLRSSQRPPATPSAWTQLREGTRLYGRSKGLTLVAEAIAFTVGLIPLLYTARLVPLTPRVEAVGLYLTSAAFFLLCVWIGLRLAPGWVDRVYYQPIGDVRAAEPTTPDWGRFLAPLCVMGPIGAVAVGFADPPQAVMLGLALVGLLLYAGGRYAIREPGTWMIGAVAVLLSGLIAAQPDLVAFSVEGSPAQLRHVVAAQSAAVSLVLWLWIAWVIGAIALHAYGRWLLGEVRRSARELIAGEGENAVDFPEHPDTGAGPDDP